MNREESLKEFKEKIVKALGEESIETFEKNFKDNEEKVKRMLINGMRTLINRAKNIKENNGENKIAVFQFELLRINILNESYKILIHGYNSSWYLDTKPIYEEIDLSFLFEPFIKVKEKLIKEKRIYMGKVNNYDIQKMIFELVVKCYKNMSKTIRNWFWNLDEEEWIKERVIEDFYIVKWSEYQGRSETLFAMDNREKNIKELLELKEQPEEKLPFVYTVWKNSILEDGVLAKQNMLFINFKGSNLKDIDFSECNILRGQFKDTEVKRCTLVKCNLIGSSFENAKIEDSDFSNGNCTGVDFRQTELRYVNFSNSNLKNSNFINAKFKNVSFEGADLEDAVFSAKDIPFINLTSEQLQTIYIDGGEER
ncbi:pentapeptide repeat-containing protein [Clostridium saccharobutylicum]|uniref:Secreted effector protein pipB2 n=1 Tax=Clostridium saccharobutylicum TaxID=169679 RepID=A0A1S8N5H6_CLOSA|nr:pentapeptide repeat-containing protein [Clostridium saccharobutylicum]OOM11724.1 secreted effector protein pipB2 [Clostridium saccharobutylicum]